MILRECPLVFGLLRIQVSHHLLNHYITRITNHNRMEQLEFKYKKEITKNSHLLRMNSALMTKNDLFNRCIYSLHLLFYPSERLLSPEHQFEQEELEHLLAFAKKNKEGEQCTNCQELEEELQKMRNATNAQGEERWKALYLKESQQTFRLSKINASLMDTVRQLEVNRKNNEEELKMFLEDYLELFRKIYVLPTVPEQGSIPQQNTLRQQSTTKKRERSKSLKKPRKSQQKGQKLQKEKTILFEQSKQSKAQKQQAMLNRLRQMAVAETEVVRKQLVETLKVLKLSQQNARFLRRSLMEKIVAP